MRREIGNMIEEATTSAVAPFHLRPRREVFEFGLLPLPKLIFNDGISTLEGIKRKLLGRTVTEDAQIDARGIAEVLEIPMDHALLVVDTLASVLPFQLDSDPLKRTVDVYYLVIFLYVQSYKRLLPKGYKDSTSVGDVWPRASAFDGYLSALSPIPLVRNSTRRFMPSQADEEAHQLSYLQKHLTNIILLLTELAEENDNYSRVLTQEKFDRLEFLIHFGDKSPGFRLSHVAQFFADSDPDMPNSPVPVHQALDWLLQSVSTSLANAALRMSTKEERQFSSSDMDVSNPNYSHGSRTLGHSGGQTFVEGISKASVIKHPSDIKGNSVKVLNCHDSVIYVLAPVGYATIYGCSDITVVLGAVGKAVKVEHCERVQVIAATSRICIATCRECSFFLGVTQRPLILGDNHKLKVAPYNTFYPLLIKHMEQAGLNPAVNRWNEPLALGMVDPHDSLSHPAGLSEVPAQSATSLDPDHFTNFLIPGGAGDDSTHLTKDNPFRLPEAYFVSQRKRLSALEDIQQALKNAQLEEHRKRELASALHLHFKDWLYASGNVRQLYCVQGE
ncbi:uncharacterized protein LOC144703911 [Wolffia australiana]